MEREGDKRGRVRIDQVLEPSGPDVRPVGPVVGEIANVDAEGRATVVFPGHRIVPTPARCAISPEAMPPLPFDELSGRPVLLVFEADDPERPVIVGFVSDALPRPLEPSIAGAVAKVDGERVVLEGEEEVVLRCGKSTIVLKKDGRVLVRGTHLVSRSSGPNWIRGGSINLN